MTSLNKTALNAFIATSFLATATILIGHTVANKMTSDLEAAVELQCNTADWPADLHKYHADFCNDKGYELPAQPANGLYTGI